MLRGKIWAKNTRSFLELLQKKHQKINLNNLKSVIYKTTNNYNLKMKKNIITIIISFTIAFSAQAQKETNIWYFGDGVGLKFEKDTSKLFYNAGVIQMANTTGYICDKNGEMLFYTDGITAWNGKNIKIKSLQLIKIEHEGYRYRTYFWSC